MLEKDARTDEHVGVDIAICYTTKHYKLKKALVPYLACQMSSCNNIRVHRVPERELGGSTMHADVHAKLRHEWEPTCRLLEKFRL